MGAEIFHALKNVLQEAAATRRASATRAASPRTCKSNEEALETILEAIEQAGYKPGDRVLLALDPAASEFYDGKTVRLQEVRQARADRATRWSSYWTELGEQYPILSIEDGLAENDWDGWKMLTDALGDKVQLVGDDLFVTNTECLAQGHRARRRQLDPDQGQPDRHAHRDARRDRAGAARNGCTADHLAPLGRDRRHLHRRPRGRHQRRPDQDRLAFRAPTASPSTTSSSASKKTSATRRAIPGLSAFYQLDPSTHKASSARTAARARAARAKKARAGNKKARAA